jgi:phosphatidylserine decarboxylase
VFDSATKAKDIWIKGRKFSVHELLDPRGNWSSGVRGENVSSLLSDDSTIAIFRLAPADYHRFHHPVGPVTVLDHQRGGQEYYTVNPDAVNENFDVFTGNVRDVCLLKWNTFTVGFAAIGALLVGSIRYTNADSGSAYQRGGEMGYFAYGGSTVIAVFPAEAKVKWDEDLRANSLKGLETLIKVNERIGVSEA